MSKKSVLSKLSSEEKKKLKKLEKEDAITLEKMLKAQSKDNLSLKARKLADKGNIQIT